MSRPQATPPGAWSTDRRQFHIQSCLGRVFVDLPAGEERFLF